MTLLGTWITVLGTGALLLALARLCQARRLPPPPLPLPLAALAGWGLARTLPALLAAAASRSSSAPAWTAPLDELLIAYAAIRLSLWLGFEIPGQLGWWRRPPKLMLQLIMMAGAVLATVLVVRQTTRFDLVGLVTTSAVLTAVLGLAAQEPLKDLLAALELQMGEEIRAGDLIELKDGSRGVVQAVSWRDTTLRTLDDVLLVVPNTEITQGVVRNLSFHGRVALRFSVGLDAAYPPGQARRLLERVVRQHPRVLSDPAPVVRLQAFAESAVAYELQVWQRECSDRALLDLRSELQEQIWYALRREGQRLPSPVRELRPRPGSLDSFPRPLPTLEERCNALANDALFSVLTPIQLGQLVERSTLVAYGAGETIMQEGAQGQSLFHLLRGQVEVCKQRPGGDSQVVRHLDAGALFGEMTLLLDAPRSATVRATEECLLLEVPRESMAALLENSPELLERFAALVASREAELKTLSRGTQQPQGSLLLERMRRLFVAPRSL